jgi:hypothetical protein
MGLHKTPIYNILPVAGQTGGHEKNDTTPCHAGYWNKTRMQTDGNMPDSFEDD